MRLMLLAASFLAVAACGDQKSSDPASPGGAAASNEAGIDANTLTPESITAKLVGSWQSAQDGRAGLILSPDGKWTETYQSTQPIVSDWRVFAGDKPPEGATETFTPASRYLEVKGEDGIRYYELGRIAGDAFDMFYTARGNNLSFVRGS